MARICAICDKRKRMGHTRKLLRGHYNITGDRTFKPNLQKVKVEGVRVLACVNCIRTMNKAGKV